MGRVWCLLALATLALVEAAPRRDLDAILDEFLERLYEEVHQAGAPAIYDQMQGDQPQPNDVVADEDDAQISNLSASINMSQYLRTSRNRLREPDDDRAKDNWIQALKANILRQIGRSNMTVSRNEEANPLNMTSILPNIINGSFYDENIAEKIRSYYPSCEVPSNMEQDLWKDENVMNLYFKNFDKVVDKNLNIATATLRLYRIPTENLTRTSVKHVDCDNSTSLEEDRLLRVSIYWYTKSIRKKKVKKRLSDSKVIQETARWVELSVKPATRAWSKGKNLGLGVVVEDQEGLPLRADHLFKGALCMVGTSTPKPIPTIILDAARQSNELDQRFYSLLGRNSTSPLSGDISMLPIIDVCTLEFPENYNRSSQISSLRISACNLRKSHEHAQLLAERDKLERLATLPEILAPRHIRHQRQHHKTEFDPRSKIVNKQVLTNEQLQSLKLNLTSHS